MSDLISRQAAINVLVAGEPYCIEYNINKIRELPPAQSERPRGKWVEKDEYDDPYYECSACGASWVTIEGTPQDNKMNYCPNCGADMRGE